MNFSYRFKLKYIFFKYKFPPQSLENPQEKIFLMSLSSNFIQTPEYQQIMTCLSSFQNHFIESQKQFLLNQWKIINRMKCFKSKQSFKQYASKFYWNISSSAKPYCWTDTYFQSQIDIWQRRGDPYKHVNANRWNVSENIISFKLLETIRLKCEPFPFASAVDNWWVKCFIS